MPSSCAVLSIMACLLLTLWPATCQPQVTGWLPVWDDPFDYKSLTQMRSDKEWYVSGTYVAFRDGKLVMDPQTQNTIARYTGAAIYGLYDWAVETAGAWVTGQGATLHVGAITESSDKERTYDWWIDGAAQKLYLSVTGEPEPFHLGNYQLAKNVNTTMRIEKIENSLSLYAGQKVYSQTLQNTERDRLKRVQVSASHRNGEVDYGYLMVERRVYAPVTVTTTVTSITTIGFTYTVTSTTTTTSKVCPWWLEPYVVGSAILGLLGLLGISTGVYLRYLFKRRLAREKGKEVQSATGSR